MQNEKIKDKETVMIPVPAELLLEAGIYEGDPDADVCRRA